MPRTDAEAIGKIPDTAPVEDTLFDHSQRPINSRPGTLPGWAEWGGLRSAPQTRTIAGALG